MGIVGLVVATAEARAVDAQAEATPSPPPTPAALDISTTPSRQTVGREEPLDVFIIATNKSPTEVQNLTVSLLNDDFSAVTLPSFPSQLAGYNSAQGIASVEAKQSAQFKQQQVVFAFTYTWSNQGKPVTVVQASVASIQVVRPFDEEAKGVLGGSAALLYLLLPVIPLVLAYELVAGLLSGNLKLPTFSLDYVVPAFLFAVLVNLILLLVSRSASVDYTEPTAMLYTLGGSFIAGAVLGMVSHFQDLRLFVFWRYDQHDEPSEHLRKVLLRPGATAAYVRATGADAQGSSWNGILLRQPAAGPALSASFQVSPTQPIPANQANTWAAEMALIFTPERHLRPGSGPRKKLIEMLRSNRLTLEYTGDEIRQNGAAIGHVPVRTDLKGFDPDPDQRTPADLVVQT